MNNKIRVNWPNGKVSYSQIGQPWLDEATLNGIEIPIGCLNGSCGACEIEVNGKIIRACISKISKVSKPEANVSFSCDPYW